MSTPAATSLPSPQMEGKVILVPVRNGNLVSPKRSHFATLISHPTPTSRMGCTLAMSNGIPGRYLRLTIMRWSSTSCAAMVPMPSISCAGRAAQGRQRPYSGQFTPDGRFTSPPTGCVISTISPPLSSGCQRAEVPSRWHALPMLGQRRPARSTGSFHGN